MVRIADTDVERVRPQGEGAPTRRCRWCCSSCTEATWASSPAASTPRASTTCSGGPATRASCSPSSSWSRTRLNAPDDTRKAGVRVIIVVEDSVRRYSSFLEPALRRADEAVELARRRGGQRAAPADAHAGAPEAAARDELRAGDGAVPALPGVRRRGDQRRALPARRRRGGPPGRLRPHRGHPRASSPELAVLLQSAEPANAARAAGAGRGLRRQELARPAQADRRRS